MADRFVCGGCGAELFSEHTLCCGDCRRSLARMLEKEDLDAAVREIAESGGLPPDRVWVVADDFSPLPGSQAELYRRTASRSGKHEHSTAGALCAFTASRRWVSE